MTTRREQVGDQPVQPQPVGLGPQANQAAPAPNATTYATATRTMDSVRLACAVVMPETVPRTRSTAPAFALRRLVREEDGQGCSGETAARVQPRG